MAGGRWSGATFVEKLRRLGPLRTVRCVLEIARLHLLRARFDFDRWHAWSPYPCSPYKRDCVALVARVGRELACLEVGCGLGDLVARAPGGRRLGLDRDEAVIRAARWLHRARPDLTFRVGGLEAVPPLAGEFQVLIMVNWLHNVPREEIVAAIADEAGVARFRYLLVDEPVGPRKGHRFRHRFGEGLPGYAVEEDIQASDGSCRLVLLRGTRSPNRP